MKELAKDKHYYFNDAGLMVFTEDYHLERGYCCNNNCLHCPYQPKANSVAGISKPALPDNKSGEKK